MDGARLPERPPAPHAATFCATTSAAHAAAADVPTAFATATTGLTAIAAVGSPAPFHAGKPTSLSPTPADPPSRRSTKPGVATSCSAPSPAVPVAASDVPTFSAPLALPAVLATTTAQITTPVAAPALAATITLGAAILTAAALAAADATIDATIDASS